MKASYRRFLFLFIPLVTLLVSPITVHAIEPMEYFNSFVAGERHPGFRDGLFTRALFASPEGLAIDSTGSKLYVADGSNHRIRVVDLENGNEVSTLVGSNVASNDDGSFDKASFTHPSRLVFVSPTELVVYDSGSSMVRAIDLSSKTVKTLAKTLTAFDMVYDPQVDLLYFSQPNEKKLVRLDMKTGKVATLLDGDTQVTQPMALCFYQGAIYVADGPTSKVYQVKIIENKDPKLVGVSLNYLGQGDHILGLVTSDNILYALQAGVVPLARIGNTTLPVQLATHWGFLDDESIGGFKPMMNLQPGDVVGFASSPSEPRKLYIAKSLEYSYGIISVKDYHFDETWKAAGPPGSTTNGEGPVMDFAYPLVKPKGTFRILLSGDSRTNISPALSPGSDYGNGWFYGGDRMATMGKQLEFFLNSEAAARGIRTHFEVLEWNRAGHSFTSYCYFEIPPLVKKYNVDMVLGLVGTTGYENFYEEPINKEGVPKVEIDYEYILKPLSQRLQTPASKDLYERWKKRVNRNTDKDAYPGQEAFNQFVCNADDDMMKDLITMSGDRLKLTVDQYNSNGPVKTAFFYVPGFDQEDDCMSPFWVNLCQKYNFQFLDLTDSFNSMRLGYYPVWTRCCSDHYTAYGDRLIGYLLARDLIDEHLIPFDPVVDKKKP
jgi:hypothetical protein